MYLRNKKGGLLLCRFSTRIYSANAPAIRHIDKKAEILYSSCYYNRNQKKKRWNHQLNLKLCVYTFRECVLQTREWDLTVYL